MKNIVRAAALGLAVLIGSSFAAAQDWDHDRDDRYQRGDDYRYDRDYAYDNFQRGMRIAHQIGYQDGSQVAREDMWHGKPFNPYPRGRLRRADRGYHREYGDKNAYRDRYADGYRDGYMSAFRGYRGGYDGYGYGR